MAENKAGFRACGKTQANGEFGMLCNKGTTSVGPQMAENKAGFSP
jgi:hypothetical protein